MLINNMSNLIAFGYSILIGVLAGIIYDLFRAFRYAKDRKKIRYIGDLIFWLIVTILFFITMAKFSDGILRGFLFIGFFGGGGLYILTLSKYVFKLFLKIFKLIIHLFNEIMKIVKIPFIRLNLKKKVKSFIKWKKEMREQRKRHWRLIRGKK